MTTSLVTTQGSELEQREPNPRDLLGAFLLAQGSENTRQAYRRDLESYFLYLEGQGVTPLRATRPHVDTYARSLELEGLKPATCARKLSAVSSFYTYLVDEDYLAANPARRVKRPTVSDDSPTLGLTLDEFARLLEEAENAGPRERVLVGLLGEVGLRVSSVCEAEIGDLSTELEHRVITTRGKGGKVTSRRLPAELAAAIDELVGDRLEGLILTRPRSGKGYDRSEAARIVKRLANRAGIEKRISPHSLRHTHATQALIAGVKLEHLSVALGHSDPRTTMRYDRAKGRLENDPTVRLEDAVAQARARARETR